VYHNNFYEDVREYGGDVWYNATLQEGNWWASNTGCVDNNNDGICDNPYPVPGDDGGGEDLYPLVDPWPPTGEDTTPPASITNLANITGNFWINWTWANPSDPDFNHTMIYIDNGWVLNTSESFYNGSYSSHATKTISTHTVDTSGNINSTWVNQTTTIPNNQITITNTSGASVTEGETVYVDYDATDADSDTPTDGWGSTDNYTMTITVNNAEHTPPDPINIANTTGNFWVNHTWAAGTGNVTDSYNVSINGAWTNGTTNTYWNASYSAHAWQNITVYAWNSSGAGTLSAGSVSQDTQISNNLPVLDPIGNKAINETETLAIDADATDSDSDTLTYSCNRTDLFADFNSATGAGNWTPGYGDAGIYYVDFGASDGYGGIDNETVQITVNETEVTENLLYFSPDTSTVPGYCCSVDVDVMARVNGSNPIIATDVNITFDPNCINITNWVNNSEVWQGGSTCTFWSVPQGYVHITTSVGENPAVNGTVKIGTITIHCNNTTCCGTPLNFTSQCMFIKEGSGFIYPERDNGSFLCGWYWKDYNGEEDGGYMPDFDQNQDFNVTQPGIEENYCAPTAMANSLWWFDQKYPDRDVVSPGMSPQELIQELAWLMDTNGQRTGSPHNGTYVADEQAGIEEYLIQHGLTDLLYEHTELKPEFDWIEEEIERCQDVKLDLGFYEVINMIEEEPGHWHIEWKRIGGHAVTAVGVNSNCSQIAISDTDADNAEFGLPGVVRGTNHNHGGVLFWDPAYDHTQHNDCVSASHDIYNVAPSISPGGTWELTDPYWRNATVAYRYAYNNGEQWMNTTNYNGSSPPMVGDIRTEIEAAVVVSPKDCTPAIEVNKTVWDPVTEEWVEEITANVSEIVRFKIWIHNNGTCCNLSSIVVNDTLSESLEYADNATVNGFSCEPEEIVTAGNSTVVRWFYNASRSCTDPFNESLEYCQNITIEFDAHKILDTVDTNCANVSAWCDSVPPAWVFDEDCVTVNPAPMLNITLNPDDTVTLNWTSTCTLFDIYITENLTAGFAAEPNVTVSAMSWTDMDAPSHAMRYYKVACNGSGEQIEGNVTKIAYELKKGANWITMPSMNPPVTDAECLIGAVGTNCPTVAWWNATSQSMETYTEVMSGVYVGTNFDVKPGRGYEVQVSSDTEWSVVGWVPSICPIDLKTGANWIGMPFNTTIDDADELIEDITNCDTVAWWNPVSQSSETYTEVMPGVYVGTNFDVKPARGYEVQVTADATWTPR